MFATRFAVLSVVAAIGATSATAQATRYAIESGWTVYVNNATLGCFAERVQPDGYVFQLGQANKGDDFGFLALYANEDVGIETNEANRIVFQIDGTAYQGYSIGNRQDQYDGGVVYTANPAFAEALSDQSELTMFPGEENQYTVDVAGIGAAIAKTRECITTQGG
ncbi:MAG: hypothetical protein AAGB28_19595 [Pseudomonadota bacterium]